MEGRLAGALVLALATAAVGCEKDGADGKGREAPPAGTAGGTAPNGAGGDGRAEPAKVSAPAAPLRLEVDPTVPKWEPLPDLTSEAEKRLPWDNFTSADPLQANLTQMAPLDQVEAQWGRYEADPIDAIMKDGKVHFQIVNALYRKGIISPARKDETLAKMREYVRAHGDDPVLKVNEYLALTHLGFEEEAFRALETVKGEEWFRKSWDANFYTAMMMFRHRRFAEARPFLETAVELDPRPWSRLWLKLALHDATDSETVAAREGMFRFGEHMGKGTAADLPFREVSDRWGIRRWHLAGAVAFTDLDQDSFVDFVGNGVYAYPEVYRFTPGKGFAFSKELADKAANVPSGLVAADFDNDGFPDLYMASAAWFGAGPNKMFRNVGGKSFEDVTGRGDSALVDQNSCGISTLDYDRDGLLDLAVTGIKGGALRLLKNMGGFEFREVTKEAGLRVEDQMTTIALAVGDIDDDGDMDIFRNSMGPNALYVNQGDGTFKEEGGARGVVEGTFIGFGSWMFDYDNDGDMDILAGSFATDGRDESYILKGFQFVLPPTPDNPRYLPSALYQNDGTGHFANVANEVGITPSNVMGAGYADFDLDGDLDVILGPGSHPFETLEPVFLYRNDGGEKFTNITPLDDPLYYGKFHGMSFADLDRDGDPELYLNNGGVLLADRFRDLLLENTTTGKHWLHLQLVGTKSNRSAVGARVTVKVGHRKLHQELVFGQGFSSTYSPYLVFGLDTADHADGVTIRWPNGLVQELPALAADQALVVTEGSDTYRRVY